MGWNLSKSLRRFTTFFDKILSVTEDNKVVAKLILISATILRVVLAN